MLYPFPEFFVRAIKVTWISELSWFQSRDLFFKRQNNLQLYQCTAKVMASSPFSL